jgi:hypothetical protein
MARFGYAAVTLKRRGILVAILLLLMTPSLASARQTPSAMGSTKTIQLVNGSAQLGQATAPLPSVGPRAGSSAASRQSKAAAASRQPAANSHPAFSRAPLHGQRGVTVTAQTDPNFDAKAAQFLDHIAGLGVDSVSMLVWFKQSTYVSTDVQLQYYTATPQQMQTFINGAHQRGMSVMVRPIMDDGNIIAATNGAQWRGTVYPAASDLPTWFNNYYQSILLPYASLTGVDALDIGSELTTLGYKEPARWTSMISTLRSTFPGLRLTWSSTDWFGLPGQPQPYPSFASSLDLIGIDAFFPMSGVTNGYSIAQLTQAWQPWLSKMIQLAGYYHKPMLFTEIGLASQCCTLTQPFVYNSGAAANPQAQAAYYAAACQAIRPYHIGLYWWDYDGLDPLSAPSSNNGFSPYGKPAEDEMARCYLGGY